MASPPRRFHASSEKPFGRDVLPAPRAVLFDIGLTFVHPDGQMMLDGIRTRIPDFEAEPYELVAALVMAAEARHLPLPRADSGDDKVATMWGSLLGVPAETARRAWRDLVRRWDLYCELDPDAHAVLEGLRQRGILIAAVSNSDGTLEDELRHFGLRDYFDVVVDSTVAGSEKPAPAIFHFAYRLLGVRPADCWFVGDGLVNDVLGARGTGVALALLYDRLGVYSRLEGVDRLPRLTDLLAWMDRSDSCPEETAER
jgi:HAD superfamily hydrolase (TIGR01549 family)